MHARPLWCTAHIRSRTPSPTRSFSFTEHCVFQLRGAASKDPCRRPQTAGRSVMQTRSKGAKRKTNAPAPSKAASGKPAAKRSRGRAGGGDAPPAAGSKQRAGAAGGGAPLYVVRCERQSEVAKWDKDTFTDCYGDEAEGPR